MQYFTQLMSKLINKKCFFKNFEINKKLNAHK